MTVSLVSFDDIVVRTVLIGKWFQVMHWKDLYEIVLELCLYGAHWGRTRRHHVLSVAVRRQTGDGGRQRPLLPPLEPNDADEAAYENDQQYNADDGECADPRVAQRGQLPAHRSAHNLLIIFGETGLLFVDRLVAFTAFAEVKGRVFVTANARNDV